MNRKGTIQLWHETIIITILLILLVGMVFSGLNSVSNQNYSIPNLQTDRFTQSLDKFQQSLNERISGGEASFVERGYLVLKSSWDILFSAISVIWGFITGGWIETISVGYLGLPPIFAFFIRMIYFISIGYLLLKILFKVRI